ncbi:beta-N-acetylhexosaminidase [Flavobacteriales bacterium]|nr:beta-N-acetylhexosaminidase [Flavobacteriales bacterium]
MNWFRITVLLLFFSLTNTIYSQLNNIIPTPKEQTIKNGFMLIENNPEIITNDKFKSALTLLKNAINELNLDNDEKPKNRIKFSYNKKLDNEEYILRINSNLITISASTENGAIFGFQSLNQLMNLNLNNGFIKLKNQEIKDSPRFKYRGMHLDVGRHMYPVDFIKKYIDGLAMLKFNNFHWHLTEDQGWRIEIEKYPKLNNIGSFRDSTLIGHYGDKPRQYDKSRYGGFYTKKEIKEIVKYANKRGINVIPEIEMPGHSQAAVASYPMLGCTGEQVGVAPLWGVFKEIYCSKNETFDFLEDIIDEVVELFPSKYIHIGGDEAPKTNWKACGNCQDVIEREGLKDEYELQSYFITRMEKYINSKGKQIIGWDEILEGGLAPNATVMSWRGISGGIEAAKMNHEVIMTPNAVCYLDHYQAKDTKNEPLAIGGYTPIEEIYNYEPIPSELDKSLHKYIIGAQGNVWTEYMKTSDHVEYMVFPRILALSEVVWADNRPSFEDFEKKVNDTYPILDRMNINYSRHLERLEKK